MRVTLLIRRLGIGGAERQFVEVAKGLAGLGHNVQVLTFYSGGEFVEELLHTPRIELRSLNKKGRWDMWNFIQRFRTALKAFKPQVIYSFMETSNLLTGALALLVKSPKVVWGIRTSMSDFRDYDFLRTVVFKIENFLAKYPAKIIFNSKAGYRVGMERGMPKGRSVCVFNGVDVLKLAPRFELREVERGKDGLNITDNVIAIGIVARLDPVKDHETFIRAVSIFKESKKESDREIKFFIIGSGPREYQAHLLALSNELKVNDLLTFLPETKDVVRVYNGLDIFTLCSKAEGFSNVLAEAMACGVPCVVTDVGDNRTIVGDTGEIAPRQSASALSDAWRRMIKRLDTPLAKEDLGALARARVIDLCSMPKMIEETAKVLASTIGESLHDKSSNKIAA